MRLVKSDLNDFRTSSGAQTALLFYLKFSTRCPGSSKHYGWCCKCACMEREGTYEGVASNYLAQRHNKDEIICFIRTPQSNFQLPENPETPIIMVDQALELHHSVDSYKRRVQKQKGMKVGEAHLYFGCRHPEKDYLYRTELENDEREGLISLHTAFLA